MSPMPDEWKCWYQEPVTQAFFQILDELRKGNQEHLAKGMTLHDGSADNTLTDTAKCVGYNEALDDIENEMHTELTKYIPEGSQP